MTDELPHMTPLERVYKAAQYFYGGGYAYHFDAPENGKNYAQNIRAHAKRLGYKWRVSHNIGRAWIIKEKVIK